MHIEPMSYTTSEGNRFSLPLTRERQVTLGHYPTFD
jgi:hypothetical protein